MTGDDLESEYLSMTERMFDDIGEKSDSLWFDWVFLVHPGPSWRVQWADEPKGTLVYFEPRRRTMRRRVWRLTGEFDHAKRAYRGVWPD